jgi:Pheromone A receptor
MQVVFSAIWVCNGLYHAWYVYVHTSSDTTFSLTFSLAEYIVQGHRFNIYEDLGCVPTYHVWPVYPIVFLPPIFIRLFSATHCILPSTKTVPNSRPYSQATAACLPCPGTAWLLRLQLKPKAVAKQCQAVHLPRHRIVSTNILLFHAAVVYYSSISAVSDGKLSPYFAE